jgi:hypothetical protein
MGTRFHARDGLLYVGALTGSTATLATFISSFTLDAKADRVDVTAFGDTNRQYVQGYGDAQGTFEGFRESGAVQIFKAAEDGEDRAVYFYEDRGTMTSYWFFRAFFDVSGNWSVSDAAKVSGSWAANSTVSRSGIT